MIKKDKQFLTTGELAHILGISRIAVFKKIKSGQIKAVKEGRQYFVPQAKLPEILGHEVSDKQKKDIRTAVDKVIKEYGTTLKLLAKE